MSTEYTKTTWQTGDIITADKMNNIENGIKGIEGDITTLSGMGSEIDELGEELTDIKDGFSEITAGTRNLLRKLIIGSGIGPDGNILTNDPSLWYCPDYITAGKVTIKANGSISGYSVNFRVCEYDSNKTFLRRNTSYTNPTVYTPQNDCAFMRFSFYGTVSGSESVVESFKLQAEYGETATEYISPITAYDMTARGQIADLDYRFKENIDSLVMLENNFTTPLNLFSPNNTSLQGNGTVFPGTCTNVDNRSQASDRTFYSFYIPVKEETTYAISFAGLRVVFFDVHKNTISIKPLTSYSSAIVTTPSGCCYMGVVSNGNQSQLMVVEGNAVPSSYQTSKAEFSGTVGKNISLSADTNEPIEITGIGNFVIDGNGHSIDLGVHLTGTQGSNYIEIPYSTTTGRIYKVCVTKEIAVEDTYTTLSVGYNTTLWASYADPTQDFKLVPVTSMSALASTSNSFYYDGTKIYINIENPAVEYVLADDEDMHYGLNISGSIGKVKDLTIKYSSMHNCIVQNGSICEFTNCHFLYSGNRGGIISASKSAVILNRCEAFKARIDGMDTTADGQVSTMIQNDCHCHYNYDDGSSHHKGKFFINGGEYDHNHKGGVAAPCYLSEGNVTGAYIHDNDYAGVYAVNTSEQGASQFIISNCLFKGNARNYHLEWYSAISYNNVYADTPLNPNSITNAQLLEYGN